MHAIAPVIPGFKTQFEKINIVLTSSESIIDLIDRNVDVAIRIGELRDSSLKARRLGDSYRKIYAAPEYLETHSKISKVSDLIQHTCLGFLKPEKLNTWPVVTENGDWMTVKPEIIAGNDETLK